MQYTLLDQSEADSSFTQPSSPVYYAVSRLGIKARRAALVACCLGAGAAIFATTQPTLLLSAAGDRIHELQNLMLAPSSSASSSDSPEIYMDLADAPLRQELLWEDDTEDLSKELIERDMREISFCQSRHYRPEFSNHAITYGTPEDGYPARIKGDKRSIRVRIPFDDSFRRDHGKFRAELLPSNILGFTNAVGEAAEDHPHPEASCFDHPRFNVPYSFQFSLYLNDSWRVDPPATPITSIFQLHEVPEGRFIKQADGKIATMSELKEPWRNPPFIITVSSYYDAQKGKDVPAWSIKTISGKDWLSPSKSEDPTQPDVGKLDCQGCHYAVPHALFNAEKDIGQWVDWVIDIRLSYGPEGVLRVYKDKQLVVEHFGPNSYNDVVGPRPQLGVYKWVWEDPSRNTALYDQEKTVFFDNIRIYRGFTYGGPLVQHSQRRLATWTLPIIPKDKPAPTGKAICGDLRCNMIHPNATCVGTNTCRCPDDTPVDEDGSQTCGVGILQNKLSTHSLLSSERLVQPKEFVLLSSDANSAIALVHRLRQVTVLPSSVSSLPRRIMMARDLLNGNHFGFESFFGSCSPAEGVRAGCNPERFLEAYYSGRLCTTLAQLDPQVCRGFKDSPAAIGLVITPEQLATYPSLQKALTDRGALILRHSSPMEIEEVLTSLELSNGPDAAYQTLESEAAFSYDTLSPVVPQVNTCQLADYEKGGSWVAGSGTVGKYNLRFCSLSNNPNWSKYTCGGRLFSQELTFKPHNSCSTTAFDVHAFLQRIRGQHVTFVGDSIVNQFAGSLFCTIESSIAESNVISRTTQGYNSMTLSLVDGTVLSYHTVYIYEKHGGRSCAQDKYLSIWPGKLDPFCSLNISQAVKDADILITGMGAWYHDAVQLKADISAWFDYLKASGFSGKGIWTEYLPARFPTSSSSIHADQPEPGVSCLDKGEDFYDSPAKHDTASAATKDFRVISSNQLARDNGFQVLPIYNALVTSSNDNVGWFKKSIVDPLSTAAGFTLDCRHWCMPGHVDIFPQILSLMV